MKNKKHLIIIAAVAILAFVSVYAVSTKVCSEARNPKQEQTQLLEQDSQTQNQNEALFVGCSGFF